MTETTGIIHPDLEDFVDLLGNPGTGVRIADSDHARIVARHARCQTYDDFLTAAATPLGYEGIADSKVTWHGLRLASGAPSGKFMCVLVSEFRTVAVPPNSGQPLATDVALIGNIANDDRHSTYKVWVDPANVVGAITVDGTSIARVTMNDGLQFAVAATTFEAWIS
jgi:hypothetical protein